MNLRARAALAALLVAPSAAAAENIDLSVFNPTPTTTGSAFQVQPADVGEHGDLVASAFATYASNPLVLGTDTGSTAVVQHHTMLSIGGAYAFSGFELGARLPLYMQSGQPVTIGTSTIDAPSGAATGDAILHGKLRISQTPELRLGASLALTLPTATDSQFTGSDLPSVRAVFLASYTAFPALTLHGNVGGLLRQREQFANVQQGSGVVLGAGVSFRAFERVFLNLEAFGDAIPSGRRERPDASNPMGEAATLRAFEALAGARVQVNRQMSIGGAVGRGLTSDLGAPELRGIVTFAYAPSAAALPPLRRPGAATPDDPSELDSDIDRISDADDKCPNEAEDKDRFEDEDGCPDPDNDKDGSVDASDKCPDAIEDKDGFEDDDGCPELDNDKDGVPDAKDKCADKAEKINGKDDGDGCPDTGDSLVISNPDRLELLETVSFKGEGVAKASANVLNQLAATMRARADIKRLRITVHVNPGKNAKKDQTLSDKRAAAVRAWLVNAGVDGDRIDPKGFGSSKPLVPETQRGAAEINDRIELIILERN